MRNLTQGEFDHTSIDQKKINPQIACLVLHVSGKADKIAPVRAIVLLFDMTVARSGMSIDCVFVHTLPFKPPMSISRMQKIKLSPCQRTSWGDCGVLSARLHTSDITNMFALTVLTAKGRDCSD